MFGDMKKMSGMMKQLGIKQEEVDAKRVVIEKGDGSGNIIVENPNVVKISMKGQETFQVSGDIKEEDEGVSEEDVKAVMEKTGKGKKEAEQALEKSDGDLAEAILALS